jgi:hypothetical protein
MGGSSGGRSQGSPLPGVVISYANYGEEHALPALLLVLIKFALGRECFATLRAFVLVALCHIFHLLSDFILLLIYCYASQTHEG